MLIWFGLTLRKKRLSWHTIVNVYTLALMLVDVPEVIFNKVLSWYKFPTRIFSDPSLSNHFGIMLADGIILPVGAIILTFYIGKFHNRKSTVICIAVYIILEVIFLEFGCMQYNRWNILASAGFYTVGIGTYAYFAPRFINYSPPIPYGIRLLSFVYTVNAWPTAILNPFFNLYQWNTDVFKSQEADRVVFELWSEWVWGIITALVVPRVLPTFRWVVFLGLALLTTGFGWFLHSRGILIYHNWSNYLVAVRYFVPFLITIWYDKWETKHQDQTKEPQYA